MSVHSTPSAQEQASPIDAWREVERLRATERDLRRRVEELEDFLDNGTVGLHWVGPDGTILWANRADYEMLGYTAEEYIGHNVAEFHADDEVIADILRRLSANETLINYEARLRCKDGSCRDVMISSNVRWENGEFGHTRCFTRDITERKELERRKDEFIAMASHELKTPVTSVKLYLQTLRRIAERKGDTTACEFVTKADEQLNRLNTLISELLDLSRIQGGHFELRREAFDLAALVREIAATMDEVSPDHTIQVAGPPCLPVVADRERIGQALINLLSNAIKYSPETDRVEVEIAETAESLRVSVRDFGIGIDPSYHDRIFDRFVRVFEGADATYPGMGIGLYIAREIVERHGGRLTVESALGQGATFHLVLPRA